MTSSCNRCNNSFLCSFSCKSVAERDPMLCLSINSSEQNTSHTSYTFPRSHSPPLHLPRLPDGGAWLFNWRVQRRIRGCWSFLIRSPDAYIKRCLWHQGGSFTTWSTCRVGHRLVMWRSGAVLCCANVDETTTTVWVARFVVQVQRNPHFNSSGHLLLLGVCIFVRDRVQLGI